MNPVFQEWLELILRWAHVFAGIMWVGATFFFTWLDGRFVELEEQSKDAKLGDKQFVWMVHSGGFYAVEKQKIPQLMPATLHWFKWEAAITWITGILLFGLLFYHGGYLLNFDDAPPTSSGWMIGFNILWVCILFSVYRRSRNWKRLKNSLGLRIVSTVLMGGLCSLVMVVCYGLLQNIYGPPISKGWAVGLSVFFLILGWLVYDLLWDLTVFKNEILGVAISFGILVVAIYGFTYWFSGRAAYMQLGAMLGTIMAANVWMRILPAQRRMVAALKAGQPANAEEAVRAKTRSKHNTFIVMPVVFTMISNHYSGTYGSRYNWIILSAVVLVGWAAAKVIRKA